MSESEFSKSDIYGHDCLTIEIVLNQAAYIHVHGMIEGRK